MAIALSAMPATGAEAAPATHAERMHGRAVDSFRHGRFPEAYGRFVELANAGYPSSARYALWMCEHGLALFGKNWDCAPHEVEAWARAAASAPTDGADRVPQSRAPTHPASQRRAARDR